MSPIFFVFVSAFYAVLAFVNTRSTITAASGGEDGLGLVLMCAFTGWCVAFCVLTAYRAWEVAAENES